VESRYFVEYQESARTGPWTLGRFWAGNQGASPPLFGELPRIRGIIPIEFHRLCAPAHIRPKFFAIQEEQKSCDRVPGKKRPPEMSITGGRNPPNDKGGEIVGGGGTEIIRLRIRLLCAFSHLNWRDCHIFQGRSKGHAVCVDSEPPRLTLVTLLPMSGRLSKNKDPRGCLLFGQAAFYPCARSGNHPGRRHFVYFRLVRLRLL